jgi:hypothetical protein
MKLSLVKTPAEIYINADTAAAWAVNLTDSSERQRLLQGHRSRRLPIERAGLPATDYTAADAWLIEQYKAAHAAEALPTAEEIQP